MTDTTYEYLDRDDMIDALHDWLGVDFFAKTSEEFNDSDGAIWVDGESYNKNLDDAPIGSAYTLNRQFASYINERGWHAEFYDAGTLLLYLN